MSSRRRTVCRRRVCPGVVQLTHRDMGSIGRYLGPLVPKETLICRDLMPAVDHPLITEQDIAANGEPVWFSQDHTEFQKIRFQQSDDQILSVGIICFLRTRRQSLCILNDRCCLLACLCAMRMPMHWASILRSISW